MIGLLKNLKNLVLIHLGCSVIPFAMEVGFKVYGFQPSQIIYSDIILVLENLIKEQTKYSVVSCLRVLHHFETSV